MAHARMPTPGPFRLIWSAQGNGTLAGYLRGMGAFYGSAPLAALGASALEPSPHYASKMFALAVLCNIALADNVTLTLESPAGTPQPFSIVLPAGQTGPIWASPAPLIVPADTALAMSFAATGVNWTAARYIEVHAWGKFLAPP